LLKVWKVSVQAVYVVGTKVSNISLEMLYLKANNFISVGIKEDAHHVRGINIFGRRFGNYPQDIQIRLRFRG